MPTNHIKHKFVTEQHCEELFFSLSELNMRIMNYPVDIQGTIDLLPYFDQYVKVTDSFCNFLNFISLGIV
ncbi:hypothetical protein J6590_044562 [Homalodisca vitripennis]|nr:hypothetical protein J6590_044562 [Homalodisca vitripennis]